MTVVTSPIHMSGLLRTDSLVDKTSRSPACRDLAQATKDDSLRAITFCTSHLTTETFSVEFCCDSISSWTKSTVSSVHCTNMKLTIGFADSWFRLHSLISRPSPKLSSLSLWPDRNGHVKGFKAVPCLPFLPEGWWVVGIVQTSTKRV